MSNINNTLGFIMNLDGARAVSLVDANTGLMLGAQGGTGIDLEYASAANSELYHAKLKIMKSLGIQSELEDFLITLSDQYHLLVPLLHHEGVFLYFVLDKKRATLSLARHRLKECAAQLVLE